MKIPAFLKSPRKLLTLILPLTLFLAGWWFGLPPAENNPHAHASESSQVWTCSMHPQIRQPAPGLCPICNMELIPLASGEAGAPREVRVSPEAAALLDIRVSPVVRAPAETDVRLFGRIDYDERRSTTITSRVSGRLDRLFVDFTGALVRKDDHLAEIYSPDLLVTQRELIQGRQSIDSLPANTPPAVRDTRQRLLDASREKLRLLQFSDTQIQEIETSKNPDDHLTLHSPQTGIVTAKLASEGQYVKTGDPLFKVADLSSVWLRLEAYESDLQWLRYAQDVEFQVEAIPGRTFHGRISFIDPDIDPTRRIARLRVNVENPDGALKPGMFVTATARSATSANGRVLDPSLAGKWISPMHPEIVKDGPGQCDICGMDLVPAEELGFIPPADDAKNPLLIPASAVLRTGKRAVVYRRVPTESHPVFEGLEIVLGPRVGNRFIVNSGLEEGDLVVTHGAFKLDSELQIQAKPSMMSSNAGLPEATADPATTRVLRKILAAYLPVSKALADDNDKHAKHTATTLVETIEQNPTPQTKSLLNPARQLAAATDIKSRRAALKSLSDALIQLIREHGRDSIGNAYVVNCPMALGGKGADWLSATPTVLNPYFGDAMLHCGDVTETLSAGPSDH